MASQKTLVLLCSQVSKARNLKNLRHSALFFQILKELRLERTEPEKMRQLVSPQPLAPSPYQNTNVTPIIKGSAGTCSPQMGFCFLFCWGGAENFPHTVCSLTLQLGHSSAKLTLESTENPKHFTSPKVPSSA